jgi:hypothetical protein
VEGEREGEGVTGCPRDIADAALDRRLRSASRARRSLIFVSLTACSASTAATIISAVAPAARRARQISTRGDTAAPRCRAPFWPSLWSDFCSDKFKFPFGINWGTNGGFVGITLDVPTYAGIS